MLRPFSILLALSLFSLNSNIHQQSADNVIPEGTVIQLTLSEPLSSKLSEPGDRVTATVRSDVTIDGRTILRKGTEISGRVTQSVPAKRPFKGGQLHITFDRAFINGQPYKVSAIIQSASDFARDDKVKSDSEGTLKGGTDGGKTLSNVMTAGGLGTLGAMVVILASSQDSGRGLGGFGIGRAGSVAGASVIGGSMVAGLLLTKGKEVRLDSQTIIRLKLARPIVIE